MRKGREETRGTWVKELCERKILIILPYRFKKVKNTKEAHGDRSNNKFDPNWRRGIRLGWGV